MALDSHFIVVISCRVSVYVCINLFLLFALYVNFLTFSMLLNLVVYSTALLALFVYLLCLSTMEQDSNVKDAGETHSLQSSSEKSKSRSRSHKRSKSLGADIPVKTGAVFRDPVTGQFTSANSSGSQPVVSSVPVTKDSDSIQDSVTDVINVDRSDISDLSNLNALSARLFQTDSFQASLAQAVQRAHHSTDQTALPKVEVPARPAPPRVGVPGEGRLPYPEMVCERPRVRQRKATHRRSGRLGR